MVIAIAMIVGVVATEGIRSAGVSTPSGRTQAADDGADVARDKAEIDDWRRVYAAQRSARGGDSAGALAMPSVQSQVVRAPRSRAATRNGRKTNT